MGKNSPPGEIIAIEKYNELLNYGEEHKEDGIFKISEDTDIYASGDIHGDSLLLKHILVNLAKVVNVLNNKSIYEASLKDLVWKKNNNSYVVFCGDIIDRTRDTENFDSFQDENSDLELIKTLDRLDTEARKNGGRILTLIGNHELMNFEGNFNYVSKKGHYNGRKQDFTPGSYWAKFISNNSFSVIQINNLLFAHGGFCIDFIKACKNLGLQNIIPKINSVIRNYLENKEIPSELELRDLLLDTDSVFWCRDFGYDNSNCNELNEIFEYLEMNKKNSKMIIGHTPQFLNNINSICDNKVWRIDVGASRAFDNVNLDYELVKTNLLKPGGQYWIKNYIKKTIIKKNDEYRKPSIVKFSSTKDSIFNNTEIINVNTILHSNNFNSLIDKLISQFTDENYIRILNDTKKNMPVIYSINYT